MERFFSALIQIFWTTSTDGTERTNSANDGLGASTVAKALAAYSGEPVSRKWNGLIWVGVAMLAGCGLTDNQEENFVCNPMAFFEGGPRSSDAMGMNIRGNNVLFTGSGYFNMPARSP
jgi:hypothetical protein